MRKNKSERFEEKVGLFVNLPEPGSGTTNDENRRRRF
jgi:hypothetical protein